MSARVLALLMIGLFVVAAATAFGFPPRARVYPFWVSVAGALVGLVALVRTPGDETLEGPAFGDVTRYLAWLVGFLLLAGLVGLPAGAVLFAGAFLRFEAGAPGRIAVLSAIATGVGLLAVGWALSLRWPVALYDVTRALGLS